jgi:PAS domain S-box-containing protein
MGKPLRVLIVEDSDDDVLLTIRALKKGGYDPEYKRVETAEAMRTALREQTWDIIVCDYSMPQFNGLAAIALLKETGIDIPLLIVSGAIGEETAVECMRLGAHDYIMKGNLSRLVPAIERELKEAESRSQHKQAKYKLSESEKHYRMLFNSIDEGFCIIEVIFDENEKPIDYRFLEINPSFERQTGLIDAQGKRMRELAPQHEEHWFEIYGKIALTGEPVRFENRAEQLHRWYDVYAFRNGQPENRQVAILFNDITERKRITAAMEENALKYQALFENQLNGLAYCKIVVDENNRPVDYIFLEINNAFEEHTGLKKKDVLGRRITEIIPGFEKSTFDFIGVHGRVALTGEAVKFEQYQEGLQRWYSVFVYSPKEGYFVSIFSDITDRKQAGEALKRSEGKYRAIFENAIEGIYQATTEGSYVSVNPAFAKMLGYKTPEEMISSITDIATQIYVNHDERLELIKQLDVSDLVEEFEFRAYRKDGKILWLLANARVIRDENGNIEYFEGRVQDITQRKRAEDELKNTLDSLRNALGTTIQVMVSAVETRDPYTAGHQSRSADLARAIAIEMELPREKIEAIRMAGPIHDIGKLSVPAEILSKPTKLTNIEFALIKEHVRTGYEMLKDVESPWPLAQIVYQHHERMDGSGYPRNLKGDDILMEARILAVSDVVESMASHRPYRPALGLNAALEEIEKNKEVLYDADVVDVCLRLFREKGYNLV